MTAKEYFKKELEEIHLALEINNIRTEVMYKYIDQYADLKAMEAWEAAYWLGANDPKLELYKGRYEEWKQLNQNK